MSDVDDSHTAAASGEHLDGPAAAGDPRSQPITSAPVALPVAPVIAVPVPVAPAVAVAVPVAAQAVTAPAIAFPVPAAEPEPISAGFAPPGAGFFGPPVVAVAVPVAPAIAVAAPVPSRDPAPAQYAFPISQGTRTWLDSLDPAARRREYLALEEHYRAKEAAETGLLADPEPAPDPIPAPPTEIVLSPEAEAYIATLPEETRDTFRQDMIAEQERDLVWQAEQEAKKKAAEPKIPTTPKISERELLTKSLYAGRDLAAVPLTAEESAEFEAMLRTGGRTRAALPRVYNRTVTLLTPAEAAAELGVSRTAMRAMIRTREIDSIRVPGSRVVRVRSDIVWAFQNRPELLRGGGITTLSPAYRPTSTIDDGWHGVPVATLAQILRVHPGTLLLWSRRQARLGDDSMFPLYGHGANKVLMTQWLHRYRIPFTDDQLIRVRLDDPFGYSRQEKVRLERLRLDLREAPITADKVQRGQPLKDAVTGQMYVQLTEAASALGLSVGGARKAFLRAGIPMHKFGGTLRILTGDVNSLAFERAVARNNRYRPDNPSIAHNTDDDPSLVSVKDAATKLDITVRTLRRWMAAGKIEGVIRRGKLWVRTIALLAFIDKTKHTELVEAYQRQEANRKPAQTNTGANLTEDHIRNYLDWARYFYTSEQLDNIGAENMLLSRSRAAKAAGCRPSVIDQLVREGLIPARRDGNDLVIRQPDLIAASVFSAKVARMCPKLRQNKASLLWEVKGEYLSVEQAAADLKRPISEIRELIAEGHLRSVKFGKVHRLHVSEVEGPAKLRFNAKEDLAFDPLKLDNRFGTGVTVNGAANRLGVSERTVLRWVHDGTLLASYSTKKKWKQTPMGWTQIDVPTNRGCVLITDSSVRALRRLRQVRGLLPLDTVNMTQEQIDEGRAPELSPWQKARIVEAF